MGLNSTLCATERALCCLVENYQEDEGMRVPRALVPFMLGQEFLPYVKTLKEDKKEKKDDKKAAPKKEAAAPKKEAAPKEKVASPKAEAKAEPKAEPKSPKS